MFGWKRGSLTWTVVGNFSEKIKRNHRLNRLYADLHSMWYQCCICCLFWLLLHSKDLKSNEMRFTYVYITRLKHLHMIKQTYCHCITARGQMNIIAVTTDSSVFWLRTFMWNASPLSPWVAKVWSQRSLPRTSRLTSLISKWRVHVSWLTVASSNISSGLTFSSIECACEGVGEKTGT